MGSKRDYSEVASPDSDQEERPLKSALRKDADRTIPTIRGRRVSFHSQATMRFCDKLVYESPNLNKIEDGTNSEEFNPEELAGGFEELQVKITGSSGSIEGPSEEMINFFGSPLGPYPLASKSRTEFIPQAYNFSPSFLSGPRTERFSSKGFLSPSPVLNPIFPLESPLVANPALETHSVPPPHLLDPSPSDPLKKESHTPVVYATHSTPSQKLQNSESNAMAAFLESKILSPARGCSTHTQPIKFHSDPSFNLVDRVIQPSSHNPQKASLPGQPAETISVELVEAPSMYLPVEPTFTDQSVGSAIVHQTILSTSTDQGEQPEESLLISQPAEPTFTEKPARSPLVDQPLVSEVANQPAESASVNQPADLTKTDQSEQPVEALFSEQPVESTSVEQPVRSPFVDQPVESEFTNLPVGPAFVHQPTEFTETDQSEQPVETTLVFQPEESTFVEQPVKSTSVDQPAGSIITDQNEQLLETVFSKQPVEPALIDQPVEFKLIEQPLETVSDEQHLETSSTNHPMDSHFMNRPVESFFTEQPVKAAFTDQSDQTVGLACSEHLEGSASTYRPVEPAFNEQHAQTSFHEPLVESTSTCQLEGYDFMNRPVETFFTEHPFQSTSIHKLGESNFINQPVEPVITMQPAEPVIAMQPLEPVISMQIVELAPPHTEQGEEFPVLNMHPDNEFENATSPAQPGNVIELKKSVPKVDLSSEPTALAPPDYQRNGLLDQLGGSLQPIQHSKTIEDSIELREESITQTIHQSVEESTSQVPQSAEFCPHTQQLEKESDTLTELNHQHEVPHTLESLASTGAHQPDELSYAYQFDAPVAHSNEEKPSIPDRQPEGNGLLALEDVLIQKPRESSPHNQHPFLVSHEIEPIYPSRHGIELSHTSDNLGALSNQAADSGFLAKDRPPELLTNGIFDSDQPTDLPTHWSHQPTGQLPDLDPRNLNLLDTQASDSHQSKLMGSGTFLSDSDLLHDWDHSPSGCNLTCHPVTEGIFPTEDTAPIGQSGEVTSVTDGLTHHTTNESTLVHPGTTHQQISVGLTSVTEDDLVGPMTQPLPTGAIEILNIEGVTPDIVPPEASNQTKEITHTIRRTAELEPRSRPSLALETTRRLSLPSSRTEQSILTSPKIMEVVPFLISHQILKGIPQAELKLPIIDPPNRKPSSVTEALVWTVRGIQASCHRRMIDSSMERIKINVTESNHLETKINTSFNTFLFEFGYLPAEGRCAYISKILRNHAYFNRMGEALWIKEYRTHLLSLEDKIKDFLTRICGNLKFLADTNNRANDALAAAKARRDDAKRRLAAAILSSKADQATTQESIDKLQESILRLRHQAALKKTALDRKIKAREQANAEFQQLEKARLDKTQKIEQARAKLRSIPYVDPNIVAYKKEKFELLTEICLWVPEPGSRPIQIHLAATLTFTFPAVPINPNSVQIHLRNFPSNETTLLLQIVQSYMPHLPPQLPLKQFCLQVGRLWIHARKTISQVLGLQKEFQTRFHPAASGCQVTVILSKLRCAYPIRLAIKFDLTLFSIDCPLRSPSFEIIQYYGPNGTKAQVERILSNASSQSTLVEMCRRAYESLDNIP